MLFPSTFPSMVTPAFDRSSSLFSSSLMLSATAESMNAANFAPSTLLYYTVLLNCEYIGINPNCTAAQRISALAHELGHALFDRKHASSGQAFQDTCFYSLDNSKAERRANIFASDCFCLTMIFSNRLAITNSMPTGFIWRRICHPTHLLLTGQ